MFIGWTTYDFLVRAKRGEIRGRGGLLRKNFRTIGSTIAEVITDAQATHQGGDRIAPGYAVFVGFVVFDLDDWNRDPHTAPPYRRITSVTEFLQA